MWEVAIMENRSKVRNKIQFDYVEDLGEYIATLDTETYELIGVERVDD